MTALSETTILRNHVMYQTSYVPSRPSQSHTPSSTTRVTSVSPDRRRTKAKKPKQKTKPQTAKLPPKVTKPREGCKTARKPIDDLDIRRVSRATRPRPWQEKVNINKKPSNIHLFYERTLPKDSRSDQMKLKTRRYVSNTKYGDIYEIREEPSGKKSRTPSPKTYMWGSDFYLWSTTNRDRYMENTSLQRKRDGPSSASTPQTDRSIPSIRTTLQSTSRSLSCSPRNYRPGSLTNRGSLVSPTLVRPGSLPRPGSNLPSYRGSPRLDRPHPDIYAYYNSYRLDKQRRKKAAILIQKTFRGWLIRTTMRRLKRKALLEHSRAWRKFIGDYRQLIARIRSRYGIMKTSCRLDLRQLELFMDNKKKYETVFRKMSSAERLHKDDLLEFFNQADLYPTEADVNKSFSTVFRGSGNTAEVMFLLDCSSSAGVVGFDSLLKFVRDIILGLDIAPDRARVGVIPFNEDAFNTAFSFTEYKTKLEILEAVSNIKIRPGLTRTDLALKLMLEMFKESRPGVQKVGIVITDGKSNDPDRTEREAKAVRNFGIEVFAIGIGMDVKSEELNVIASRPENVFFAYDSKSLVAIRGVMERRFCLETTATRQDEVLQDTSSMCRPLLLPDVLEVVWTCYPPQACDLDQARVSRWIRPIVNGEEAWSLLDDRILRSTNMKTCLRLVIRSKLDRDGFIDVPSDVRDGIEKVTNQDQALEILEDYIRRHKKTI